MARRASQNSSNSTILLILVAVAVVAGLGFFLMNRKPVGFDSPSLPVDSFLDNANALRGNVYSVEGRVHSIVSRDSGKFIHLAVDDSGREKHVFVVVPSDLQATNIEREQSYGFQVTIQKGGIPEASAVKRL